MGLYLQTWVCMSISVFALITEMWIICFCQVCILIALVCKRSSFLQKWVSRYTGQKFVVVDVVGGCPILVFSLQLKLNKNPKLLIFDAIQVSYGNSDRVSKGSFPIEKAGKLGNWSKVEMTPSPPPLWDYFELGTFLKWVDHPPKINLGLF